MRNELLLKVEELKVWFPLRRSVTEVLKRTPPKYVRAVDGVSFEILKGEVFCLVGESGCGKTTTGRAVLRLVDPEYVRGGRVLFAASDRVVEEVRRTCPEALDERTGMVDVYKVRGKALKMLRREMQIVFQDPFSSLNPRYTVKQILEEPLLIHGIGSEEERLEMVRKVLEVVKLTPPEDFMSRYPHHLSGGQRQRVSIARALILNPRFIVADEPVSMLDVSIRAEILELLLELREKFGISLLFITHDLALAKHICDRVAVMYLGKIVEVGPTEEVIDDPAHPYTKALVAAIPEPDPENRKKLRDVPIKGEVSSAADIPAGCRFRPRCVVYDKLDSKLKSLCETREPRLVEVSPGRYAACWSLVSSS